MTAEKLSDALCFLDDDIIEEAQTLRAKKRNYKRIWIKALSVAACLCIALVAFFGAVHSFDLSFRGGGTNGAPQTNFPWAGASGESQPVGEFKYGGFIRATYYVEITKWGEMEFEGIIKGSEGGSGELPLNEKLTVKFDENILVKKQGEKLENRIPTEEDFPAGSRVEVLVNDYDASKLLGTSEVWICSIGDLNTPQTVLVRIDEWNEGGFMGELCGENGKEVCYYTSHMVTVEFTEDTRTEKKIDRGTTTLITLAPTEEDFPVGTVVEVSYDMSEQRGLTETIYTAERIWLYE